MKYHRNFFTNFQINITTPMCNSPILSSDMTMISDFIIIINQFTTNPTNTRSFKFLIFLYTHNQVFTEMFFSHPLTIIIFFKNTVINLNTASLLNLLSIQIT